MNELENLIIELLEKAEDLNSLYYLQDILSHYEWETAQKLKKKREKHILD